MISLSELSSKRVHFIGIGGAGMSGLARIALTHGAHVSGSDEKDSSVLAALAALGATVFSSHSAEHVNGADLVIYSNAISQSNAERVAAAAQNIPTYTRAQALALLMSQSISIAVAGTHGKTTTSSMLTVALQACGVDPSFAIGGTISASGSNAHRGTGEYFVAEADESDGSFIEYKPFGAIVTNVEHDHVDYFATPADVTAAFQEFARTISPEGFMVYCADDAGSLALGRWAQGITCISYGEHQESDLHIDQVELGAKGSRARALWKGKSIGHLELNVPGRHNIDNAAAALAVGLHLGLPTAALLAGLASFAGTGRRFELKGTVHGIRVIDDYGHHPTEIKVTLEAARRYAGDGRLLVIFQPHRYSRTQAFMSAFATALSLADYVSLLEIYAASEKPIPGVSSEVIAESMANGKYIPNFVDATDEMIEMAKPGDVIITLGAGDVSSLGPIIIEGLTKRFAGN
ncbi:MAG: UDP-N-acetylmuramate--L-alanine ligase [Actinobacteria bacterium]|jgi:UDP-N-acetylmuramate--alanine ligase|nr:UDP-N-acetylmuramate--L-alanine ligase [Actinomycetota bacterium]NDA95028.1 UDP-N-acetylmuramate--L-alanine ligase [Actinomycetota bacterium]NDH80749.1 UDP-N-acetylmuramate--L-alanine ligase [Actinomycetota bacterium]NDH98839.1 UDP-N-acetylmuramate--L-alanine ligase [Actinomycetota bacterium]